MDCDDFMYYYFREFNSVNNPKKIPFIVYMSNIGLIKGGFMNWVVKATLVCPYTGTVFSTIQSVKNLQLIIWYSAVKILLPSDIISPDTKGFIVNGHFQLLELYKLDPYNDEWWEFLKSTLSCPANTVIKLETCTFPSHCHFKKCPYGCQHNNSALKK